MRTSVVWIALVGLSWAYSQVNSIPPTCAVRCWENTKYVSKCESSDEICLCNEVEYRTTVFQCLYSQCDTALFGSALQFTISQCSVTAGQTIEVSLPKPSYEELRRRESEYLEGTGGTGGTMSNPDFEPELSVLPPTILKQRAAYGIQSIYSSASAVPSPSPTYPFEGTSTHVEPTMTAIEPSFYTGDATKLATKVIFSFSIIFALVYISF